MCAAGNAQHPTTPLTPCNGGYAGFVCHLRRLTKYLMMGYTCINGGENKVPQVIVTALRPKRLAAGVLNK